MRMVVAGVIGSRITWVLSHLDELDSPLDAIAIWQGGLQFSGGFVFAVIAGYPVYRHWNRLTRWHSLDGYAYGLTIGLGHRSHRLLRGRRALRSAQRRSRWPSATTAAPSARSSSATVPLEPGMVFHQTALYELIYMLVLFVILTWLLYGRKQRPGTGHRDGDLLRLLRRGPLRLRLAPGERRDGARAHRRAVPLPRHAADQRLDLVPGAQAAGGRTIEDGMPVGVGRGRRSRRGSERPTRPVG